MKLAAYTNEIIAIAKKNNVSWNVAADMFIANVKNAGEEGLPYYAGADDVDYGALKEYIQEMELSKQAFIDAYNANATAIVRLRKERQYDAVVELMGGEEGD